MRSLSRDRSRLVLWLPTVKERMIKSWFDHGRGWFCPAGGAGRNQDAALSPLLAVANVPLMLACLIACIFVAFGGSFAVSRSGTSRDMRAGRRLSAGKRHRLQSANSGRPCAVGPLVRGRNADHLKR
jgi:hypothetical protein